MTLDDIFHALPEARQAAMLKTTVRSTYAGYVKQLLHGFDKLQTGATNSLSADSTASKSAAVESVLASLASLAAMDMTPLIDAARLLDVVQPPTYTHDIDPD